MSSNQTYGEGTLTHIMMQIIVVTWMINYPKFASLTLTRVIFISQTCICMFFISSFINFPFTAMLNLVVSFGAL